MTRPFLVRVTVGVLAFLGITAIAGGAALTLGFPDGARPPDEWLGRVPMIDSWLVPGLVLGLGFGAGSLLAAYGILKRPHWKWLNGIERTTCRHWSWSATILFGLGQMAWIALELVYLPGLSFLEVLYGCVGTALVVLALTGPVRRHLSTVAQP